MGHRTAGSPGNPGANRSGKTNTSCPSLLGFPLEIKHAQTARVPPEDGCLKGNMRSKHILRRYQGALMQPSGIGYVAPLSNRVGSRKTRSRDGATPWISMTKTRHPMHQYDEKHATPWIAMSKTKRTKWNERGAGFFLGSHRLENPPTWVSKPRTATPFRPTDFRPAELGPAKRRLRCRRSPPSRCWCQRWPPGHSARRSRSLDLAMGEK